MEKFTLTSALKRHTLDQDKVIDPKETVKKALAGLRQMYDLSNLKLEQRPNTIDGAYSFASLSDQFNASGKGLTKEQSQASAIMEFAERYSWLHFDYENSPGYLLKSYQEIVRLGLPAVPESYFLSNFVSAAEHRAVLEEVVTVPLKWVRGSSLVTGQPYYYPINWHNMTLGSNGLSAGNCLEETLLQGLCEVIERENVYRFIVEKKPGRDLDLNSVKNDLVTRALKNAAAQGIKINVKEISYELGIPTFVVCGVCEKHRGKLAYKGVGQGTHPDPEKALTRSLAEYFEGFYTMCKIQNEAEIPWARVSSWLPKMHLGFLVRLNPEMLDPGKSSVRLDQLKRLTDLDIKVELERLIAILQQHNYEVAFMDKTHPKLKVPAVRVFVPGMRTVINHDISDPYSALSEVLYEAGDKEVALKYFHQSVRRSQVPGAMKSEMLLIKSADKLYSKDYRETLIKIHGIKKDSLGLLKQIGQQYKRFEQLA